MALTEAEMLSLKPGDVVEHVLQGKVTVRSDPWAGVGGLYLSAEDGRNYHQSGIRRIVSRAADKPKPGPAERCLETSLAVGKANKDHEDAVKELLAYGDVEISKYLELVRQNKEANHDA